jgi:hypothetical protein
MRFIDGTRDRFAVAPLIRVLNIGESTYGAWSPGAKPAGQAGGLSVAEAVGSASGVWLEPRPTHG